MPQSKSEHQTPILYNEDEDEDDEADEERIPSAAQSITPVSPTAPRKLRSALTSELDLRSRLPSRLTLNEYSSLLGHPDGVNRSYTSVPATPSRPRISRHQSTAGSPHISRNHSRAGSFGLRLSTALGSERRRNIPNSANLEDSKASFFRDDRVWYDQFTSTDWVHDSIADAFRVKALRSRKDIRGRLEAWFDGAQGWILVAIIGCITAIIAYFVDVTESAIFDIKHGYCNVVGECSSWSHWSEVLQPQAVKNTWIDFGAYVVLVVALAVLSCLVTLMSKTVVPSAVSLSTLDENLGAHSKKYHEEFGRAGEEGSVSPTQKFADREQSSTMIYYSAAGSGVAEVKVILSGFVLHGYLGVKTLVIKTLALVLSVASGLSLGKEGPYVHIATCVGNIACRLFSKYNRNDGKRREVLSASAASGVAVAFGAPIGGVLFSLEEVSYYFPPKTLFRTFFCCITNFKKAAALSLKFLNPYGTSKIVLFEVRYVKDWKFFEMVVFIGLGILGGAAGALFIKASKFWAQTFRRIPLIKKRPVLEVALVALITGVVSFWNRYTRLAVTELLFELASPCDQNDTSGMGLCPQKEGIPSVIGYLCIAFLIKSILTIITFGIKVPAGIYVPSMVVGGLMGRIVGHMVQYLALRFPDAAIFGNCPVDGGPESCVVPGVYALVAAGATMCGVTRLSVTLAVILFELTGSLDHVLPFSIAVLVSKWTADALEPLSIYDLLTDMNSYPFLDNKVRPIFTTELGDITPRLRRQRIIDISNSPLVLASDLRRKLEYLQLAGELDGGLPIIRHGILVGLIPAPDLEFALDKLESEEVTLCLMATHIKLNGFPSGDRSGSSGEEEEGDVVGDEDPTDFTPYIDPAPVALDVKSPMDLAYECFVKLGLRYLCVTREGLYAGLVHKKAFVKYMKELE
ncbi:MAG: hypothetical protein M1827_007486 [Pycnora praestabilis]|nr:MAG: hypothetical protein M1827_007486 [Pycnora praestabilis]